MLVLNLKSFMRMVRVKKQPKRRKRNKEYMQTSAIEHMVSFVYMQCCLHVLSTCGVHPHKQRRPISKIPFAYKIFQQFLQQGVTHKDCGSYLRRANDLHYTKEEVTHLWRRLYPKYKMSYAQHKGQLNQGKRKFLVPLTHLTLCNHTNQEKQILTGFMYVCQGQCQKNLCLAWLKLATKYISFSRMHELHFMFRNLCILLNGHDSCPRPDS